MSENFERGNHLKKTSFLVRLFIQPFAETPRIRAIDEPIQSLTVERSDKNGVPPLEPLQIRQCRLLGAPLGNENDES